MQLPIFYIPDLEKDIITLDENTSKHVVQVLRMEKGEHLLITDGKGKTATTIIQDDHRKKCEVRVLSVEEQPKPEPEITIAISLIKNTARFEWFLEKATEIGVTQIIPLICERTEREKFRYERLHGILESAMVQSRQAWMPILHEPMDFHLALATDAANKFIAHCADDQKKDLGKTSFSGSAIILIGPEGDFTPSEISTAISKEYQPVTLGATRLRTETAGIVAATFLSTARNVKGEK
jgi:16S rRNA (uracil1498-N3)-methyltransferase